MCPCPTARQHFAQNIRRIVRIQCLWRVRKAKIEYRKLRAEARNVDKIKDLNRGLENKIMELKRKLDAKTEESRREKETAEKGTENSSKLKQKSVFFFVWMSMN